MMEKITRENYLELMFRDDLTDEDRLALVEFIGTNMRDLIPKFKFPDTRIKTLEQAKAVEEYFKKNKHD